MWSGSWGQTAWKESNNCHINATKMLIASITAQCFVEKGLSFNFSLAAGLT
jgi:hypothetical protein